MGLYVELFFQFSLSFNLLTVTQQKVSWNGVSLPQGLHYGGLREGYYPTKVYVEEGPFNEQREIPFHEAFCRVPVLLTFSYYSALAINFYSYCYLLLLLNFWSRRRVVWFCPMILLLLQLWAFSFRTYSSSAHRDQFMFSVFLVWDITII